MTKISKVDLVAKLVAENPNVSRKEMISMIMTTAVMSQAAAQTYYYNAKKKAGVVAAPKAKKEKAAKKTKEATLIVEQKTADEIAKIRAERLKMIREVGQRFNEDRRANNPFVVEAVDKFDEEEEETKNYINSLIPNDFVVALSDE